MHSSFAVLDDIRNLTDNLSMVTENKFAYLFVDMRRHDVIKLLLEYGGYRVK